MSSSSDLDDQCDVARSPSFVLSDTSTLTLRLRYDIEPQSGGQYWDRANVSVRNAATGERVVIVPSSGRPYSVPNGAGNGVCGTGGQAGWNGATPGFPNLWYDASFTQAALNPGGAFTDQLAQLQINYGTDEADAGAGFDFDQVTITNFYDPGAGRARRQLRLDVVRRPDGPGRGRRRQRRAGDGRERGRDADLDEHRLRRGGVRGHGLEFHGTGGPHVRHSGHGRRLRRSGSRGVRGLHGLLRGQHHGGDAALDALGCDGHGDARRAPATGRAPGDEGLDAARRRQLHRRADRQPLLPVDRDGPPQRRDRRLRRRRHLLPGRHRDPCSRWRSSCSRPRRARDTRLRPA